MNAFHVFGGLLALWAVIVSFLGITREGFPTSAVAERLVTVISIVLVVCAIGTGIYTSATEEEEAEEESAALLLR
jgi:hypothetical protein